MTKGNDVEQGLFRRQALEASRTPWLGSIRLASPLSHRVCATFSVALGIAICALLALGTYTRREKVSGLLMPENGLIDVNAWNSGTVTSISVMEGVTVKQNDLLATVSGEHVSQELGNTEANVSSSIQSQRNRLLADLESTKRLNEQQVKGLVTQQKMLRDEVAQDEGLLKIYREDATNESTLLDRMRGPYKLGYISQEQINQQRLAVFTAEAQIKNLLKSRAETEEKIAANQDQVAQSPLVTDAKINDLQRQIDQLNQALDQNEANRSTVLRASHDGVVSSVLVKPGQSVTAGQTLLTLVPQHAILQAILLVPSNAIGFVHSGVAVALHYDAYPYQKFGVQTGTVIFVSHNALNPKEISELTGQASPTEPLYEVKVNLASQAVRAYGHEESLVAGMGLKADVMLEQRRLIEWIFEPMFGAGKEKNESR